MIVKFFSLYEHFLLIACLGFKCFSFNKFSTSHRVIILTGAGGITRDITPLLEGVRLEKLYIFHIFGRRDREGVS